MKRIIIWSAQIVALMAWGWGSGHNTVGEAVMQKLPAEWQERPLGEYQKEVRHAAHFPDNGKWDLMPAVDREYFVAQGYKPGAYQFHHNKARVEAFNRLVEALRAAKVSGKDDVEANWRVIFWTMALSHSIADMAACNHDPLVHMGQYAWGKGGLGVMDTHGLDFYWCTETEIGRKVLARRVAALKPPKLPKRLTPLEVQVTLCNYEWDAISFFRMSCDLLEGATAGEEKYESLAERLCDLGLWGVERTLWLFAAAQKFAAKPEPMPFDWPTIEAKTNEYGRKVLAAHTIKCDQMTRGLRANGGEQILIIYDAAGRFGSGILSAFERYLSCAIAGSLKRAAALIDAREVGAHGVPKNTKVLIVPGAKLNNWFGFEGKTLREEIVKFHQRGGGVIWIDGTPDERITGSDFKKLRRMNPTKPGYCKPVFPVAMDELMASRIKLVPRKSEWKFERRPTGSAGWIWDSSPYYFMPDALPAGYKTFAELVTPSATYAFAIAAPRFVYLPVITLMPYVLTQERPTCQPHFLPQLDSAGRAIITSAVSQLGINVQ